MSISLTTTQKQLLDECQLMGYQKQIKDIHYQANEKKALLTPLGLDIAEVVASCNVSDKLKDSLIRNCTIAWLERKLYSQLQDIKDKLDKRILTKDEIISFFGWLFSYANIHEINIFSSIGRKFPDVCYYCLKSPCICKNRKVVHENIEFLKIPTKERHEKRRTIYSYEYLKKLYMEKEKGEKFGFDFVSQLIDKVYPENEYAWSFIQHINHAKKLDEELLELVEENSKYGIRMRKNSIAINKEDLEFEFADISIWMVSLWDNYFPSLDLDVEFSNYYYKGCSICKSKPCNCADAQSNVYNTQHECRHIVELAKKLSLNDVDDKEFLKINVDKIQEAISSNDLKMMNHYYEKIEKIILGVTKGPNPFQLSKVKK